MARQRKAPDAATRIAAAIYAVNPEREIQAIENDIFLSDAQKVTGIARLRKFKDTTSTQSLPSSAPAGPRTDADALRDCLAPLLAFHGTIPERELSRYAYLRLSADGWVRYASIDTVRHLLRRIVKRDAGSLNFEKVALYAPEFLNWRGISRTSSDSSKSRESKLIQSAFAKLPKARQPLKSSLNIQG